MAVTRDAPGAFGAPVTLAAAKANLPVTAEDAAGLEAFLTGTGIEFGFGDDPDDHGLNPRATYRPDGRPLLTWGAIGLRDGVYWPAANVATLAPLGSQVLGAELRDATSVTPLVLADGRSAAAWTDNADKGSGRIHLAIEGVADTPDPAAPTVTVSGPASHLLNSKGQLRLAVHCSAACDVRIQVPRNLDALETVSISKAGTKYVTLNSEKPLASLKTRPVKLLVRYGAPGTLHAEGADGHAAVAAQARAEAGEGEPPDRAPRRHARDRRSSTPTGPIDPLRVLALGYDAKGAVVASATEFTSLTDGGSGSRTSV